MHEREAKPRKVLFLHPSSELYGADRTLLDLVVRLDRERFHAVVRLPAPGPLAGELEAAGAEVEYGPLGIGAQASLTPRGLLRLVWDLPRAVFSTLRSIRRHRPTSIHTNTMIVLGGAIAARLSGRAHLWHIHEIPTRPEWLIRAFAFLFALLAHRVVCNSHATAKCFRSRCARLAGKTSVVWNGTASIEEKPALDDPRAALGIDRDAPLVLLPGRINSWKGQEILVEAARRLRDRHPEARYLIVGCTPPGQDHYLQTLESRIRDAGLERIVLRRDFVPGLDALLAAADLVVVPSTRPEPFGLVAIEAMAHARPVIATDAGGLAEIVVHGTTGLLVPPGDAEALAGAIADLLRSPRRAARLGRAGRTRQREHFTLRRYAEEFARHHEELASAGPRAPLPAATVIRHVVLGKANPARMNGVNVVVHELARAQAQAGIDVEVWGITADPDAPTPGRTYRLRLFRKSRNPFLAPRSLRDAIGRTEAPCVFHLHGGFLPLFPSIGRALRARRLPFVMTPHGAYRRVAMQRSAFAKRIYLALRERPLLRRARAVQAFTEEEARDTRHQASPTPVEVIPNGQAIPAPGPGAPGGDARPVFAFCGRFDVHTKGLDLLLEGLARYRDEGGRGVVRLIGDGPEKHVLTALVTRLGLEDRVRFLGARFGVEKQTALRESDLCVLTSRNEGMPIFPLEAAALARPLLLSPETNLGADVREFDAGYVLERNDPDEIARAMHRAEEDHLHDRLPPRGARAERMLRERFAWPVLVGRMHEHLYAIAARPCPAAVVPPHPIQPRTASGVGDPPRRRTVGRAS